MGIPAAPVLGNRVNDLNPLALRGLPAEAFVMTHVTPVFIQTPRAWPSVSAGEATHVILARSIKPDKQKAPRWEVGEG